MGGNECPANPQKKPNPSLLLLCSLNSSPLPATTTLPCGLVLHPVSVSPRELWVPQE